ncbi:hypothetical protein [Aquimarina sp. 2201CG5-10]|uniref:hypothetical protein n=1 Tax=Aquimarina callyspongiae TaxID=3098150 RepID=UPI002AB3BEFB|nr:hypothetical protein [Aquimarina sp. 2201CG5-10]MDY8135362.1 hypothetical protein [Aquimarina sp. 2201CG5-10]
MENIRDYLSKKNTQTTNAIAYIVLIVFSAFLAFVLYKAASLFSGTPGDKSSEQGQIWLDIFNTGFLLLGGALTTLIGYYFGNKGSEVAQSNAEQLLKEAEEKLKLLDSEAPTTEEEDTDIESF